MDGLIIDESKIDQLGYDEPADDNPKGGDTGGQLTEEQISALREKEESELTEKEKEILKAQESGSDSGDDGDDGDEDEINIEDYTDDQLEEIRNKKESELDDKEKAILEYLKEQEGDEPETAIKQFVQATGIEEFQNKEYEDSEEGLQQFTSDYKEYIKESAVKESFESYPVVKELYEHIKSGRSPETFLIDYQTPEFEDFNIEDESGQEEILRYNYQTKGLGKEEIDIILEKVKNEGKLEERSKAIHADLKVQYEQEKQAIKDQEAEQLRRNQEEAEKVRREIITTIKNKKLRGIALNDKEAKEFENYIYDVVEDQQGRKKLRSNLDYEKLSIEDKLFIKMVTKKLANGEEIKGIESKKIAKKNFKIIGKKIENRNNNRTNKNTRSKSDADYSLKDILGQTKVNK